MKKHNSIFLYLIMVAIFVAALFLFIMRNQVVKNINSWLVDSSLEATGPLRTNAQEALNLKFFSEKKFVGLKKPTLTFDFDNWGKQAANNIGAPDIVITSPDAASSTASSSLEIEDGQDKKAPAQTIIRTGVGNGNPFIRLKP